MSADRLTKAAERLRDYPSEDPYETALADWLDFMAGYAQSVAPGAREVFLTEPLRVADAILGETQS